MRYICMDCGKPVSSDVPDDSVFRAVIFCPECYGKQVAEVTALQRLAQELKAEVEDR